jgi:hypothetical protein
MFAGATRTTISCSIGRQYGPMFGLSFLDVYGGSSRLMAKFFDNMSACWKRVERSDSNGNDWRGKKWKVWERNGQEKF